ncbi:fimbrillin family protein [Parabacteroides pacaensis]|uniref:fimbrillin family protein n=1 Tax=Parabacteroides pacaensis TaxID=2086575 RepID=UPI000D0F2475|nr:fimbrillin family protein [Parabacteroides pacaensis]
MKNKKSNIPAFVAASGLVCLLLVAGCSQDDALAPDGGTDDGNTIRFTTAIADFTGSDATDNPGTRATIDPDTGTGSFANGDETTIFVAYEGSNGSVSAYSAIFRNGTWETDNLTWDAFGDGTAELNFYAFFPARTYTETLQSLSLPTDQSTAAQYAAADLLHASALRRVQGSGAVPLDFRHVMYRLTVSLSLSDTPGTLTQTDVDAATVVIKNMCTTGTVDHTGKVTTHSTLSNFIPLKSASGNSFRVLLLPQNVTPGTPWIEITASGKTVTYPVPAGLTTLHEGKEQVVNLKLTNSGAS